MVVAQVLRGQQHCTGAMIGCRVRSCGLLFGLLLLLLPGVVALQQFEISMVQSGLSLVAYNTECTRCFQAGVATCLGRSCSVVYKWPSIGCIHQLTCYTSVPSFPWSTRAACFCTTLLWRSPQRGVRESYAPGMWLITHLCMCCTCCPGCCWSLKAARESRLECWCSLMLVCCLSWLGWRS